MKKILLLLMLLSTTILNAQDVIVKKDGSTIICKVSEVGTSEVKYKKFSNIYGPLYSILVEDVKQINFENGDKEDFQKQSTPTESNITLNGDELVLNYGTEIPIHIMSLIRARDVSEGQEISFRTTSNITMNGIELIPSGTPVKGIVYKAKKSSMFGKKGKLGIRIDHLTLSDGTQIPLSGNIYVTGSSRTALSVLLFLFVTWPACFICGTKAELQPGYAAYASIESTVHFDKNGKVLLIDKKEGDYQDFESLTIVGKSSLKSFPPLPCKAVLYYNNGSKEKVEIEKVNTKQGCVYYKKIKENGILSKKTQYVYAKELQKVVFEKESEQSEEKSIIK